MKPKETSGTKIRVVIEVREQSRKSLELYHGAWQEVPDLMSVEKAAKFSIQTAIEKLPSRRKEINHHD